MIRNSGPCNFAISNLRSLETRQKLDRNWQVVNPHQIWPRAGQGLRLDVQGKLLRRALESARTKKPFGLVWRAREPI